MTGGYLLPLPDGKGTLSATAAEELAKHMIWHSI